MGAQTLAFKNNVETRKKLVGILNFISKNSEAKFLSSGTQLLSTQKEIRDTKKAQVLLPLLGDTMKVADVLKQAKSGGVELIEAELNELIVNLANEMITKPVIYRPRDGEVLNVEGLLGRYQNGFQITATTAVDRIFYKNVVKGVKDGLSLAQGAAKKIKGSILDATFLADASIDDLEKGQKLGEMLVKARAEIQGTKDKLIQSKILDNEITFIIGIDEKRLLETHALYKTFTESAYKYTNLEGSITETSVIDGNFRGSNVVVSKQLPAGVPFMVYYHGTATSLFAIRNKMNVDKIVGVEAYATSLEFDEGTGVWLPHMTTIGSSDLTALPAQDRQTLDDIVLALDESSTLVGNKTNTAGLK